MAREDQEYGFRSSAAIPIVHEKHDVRSSERLRRAPGTRSKEKNAT